MIKRLVELAIVVIVLLILISGLVYVLNNLGPVGSDIKLILKYLVFGTGVIILTIIVAITLISLVTIIFGISWLKKLTTSMPSKTDSVGGYVSNVVKNSLENAFSSFDWKKDYNSRKINITERLYSDKSFKIKCLGDVKINGVNEEKISGTVEVFEKIENDAEVFIEDGEIKLKTKSGKKAKIENIEINIPKNLSFVSIEVVSGDVSISNIATVEDSSLKSINGDISAMDFSNQKEVLIKTVNGDIEIKNSNLNSVLAQSVNGDIIIRQSNAENAVFKTVSGDIDYRDSSIKNPSIKTVSGEIRN